MNQRSAFSLVELMVALVISSMLIVTLMGLTVQLGNTARAVKKNHSSKKWAAILKTQIENDYQHAVSIVCLLYTSPSPRDRTRSRMPSSA